MDRPDKITLTYHRPSKSNGSSLMAWIKYAHALETENAQLHARIERMLPKLREHLTDEYIVHELIK